MIAKQTSQDAVTPRGASFVKLQLNSSKDTLQQLNTRYLDTETTTSNANFLSVSLLQHSSPRISFPRAKRFD
jgi:hypothetical protein